MPQSSRSLVLFDDRRVTRSATLTPIDDLRPSFELRTAAMSQRQRAAVLFGEPVAALVPAGLEGLCDLPTPVGGGLSSREVLLVNGRCLLNDALLIDAIRELGAAAPAALIDEVGDVIACALTLDADTLDALSVLVDDPEVDHGPGPQGSREGRIPGLERRIWQGTGPAMMARPWDLLAQLPRTLRIDIRLMEQRLSPTDFEPPGVSIVYSYGPMEAHQRHHAVRLAFSAWLAPQVVLDATAGPIVIDENARIQPGSVIFGPAYVGPDSELAPHSCLRGPVAIGPACKVGGEIKASVIDAQSNKAHSGYLGDSYVGQWCNLGAGTTVSNLKNTYGSVRVRLSRDREPEDTGRTHQGPIVGDAVRTGIGTRLLTGSCVGTGAMVACSAMAPKYTPPLAWLTDEGLAVQDLDKLYEALDRMMGRRQRRLGEAQRRRLARIRDRHWAQPAGAMP